MPEEAFTKVNRNWKRHLIFLAILLMLLANIGLTAWNTRSTRKVAYVRSHDLVYGYLGMKEAMAQFKSKQSIWNHQLDTMHSDLQRLVDEFQGLHASGQTEGLALMDRTIVEKEQTMLQVKESLSRRSQEEEEKMLDGVLNQVNSFVERYAVSNGYDLILGTTESGSLLYGSGGMDVTDELLAELNNEFRK